MSDTVDTMKPLTAQDRCDRCGAQAYARATLPEGTELLFCAHHARQHLPKVKEITGVRVHEETVPV